MCIKYHISLLLPVEEIMPKKSNPGITPNNPDSVIWIYEVRERSEMAFI